MKEREKDHILKKNKNNEIKNKAKISVKGLWIESKNKKINSWESGVRKN